MFVFDVHIDDIKDIVATVSKEGYDGNIIIKSIEDKTNRNGFRTTFNITVQSSRDKGSKVKVYSGRRISAACWHAHRDVLKELFERFPNARVQSGRLAKIEYNGKDDFYNKFPSTGYINMGSQAFPEQVREQCDCSDWGYHNG